MSHAELGIILTCLMMLSGSTEVFGQAFSVEARDAGERLRSVQSSPQPFFVATTNLSPSNLGTHFDTKLDTVELKRRTAPAIVRIETGLDYGTGFFFRPEGWLLTNYHVIKDAPVDVAAGRPFVRLTYGELNAGGNIEAQAEALWASVYRVDRRADLAILLLEAMPSGKTTVPFIPLAPNLAQDGETCYAIGMPAAGMKWDMRPGIVSSQGDYPDDVAIELDKTLQQSQVRRDALLRAMAPEGSLKMIVTTCGINPGDSGGPIFNEEGGLIAITKAIPRSTQEGISFDKFSYHIHLDEVRRFVEHLPISPELLPPYSKPADARITLAESTKNKAILYEFQSVGEMTSTIYVDIDRSSANLSDEQRKAAFDSPEAELWKSLGIEWAIKNAAGKPNVHYFDFDQDGAFEQVYEAAFDEGDIPRLYSIQGSSWSLSPAARSFVSEARFKSGSVQAIYDALRQELPIRYVK